MWVALGWVIAGLLLGLVVQARNPEALKAAQRIYVEDETVTEPETGVAASPATA